MIRQPHKAENFLHMRRQTRHTEGLLSGFCFKGERNDDAEARAVQKGGGLKLQEDLFDRFALQSPEGALDGLFGAVGYIAGDVENGESTMDGRGGMGGSVGCHVPR